MLGRLRNQVGVAWRFGLTNIARRQSESIIQIVAFGLGIMVLLLLSTVRNDLLDGWKQSLPDEAPNHFMINVQVGQIEGIQKFFSEKGVKQPDLHAMVRARLTRINGRTVSVDDYTNERARHKITRVFNLSPTALPQVDNVITAGRWWTEEEHGKALMSVESKLASTLGLNSMIMSVLLSMVVSGNSKSATCAKWTGRHLTSIFSPSFRLVCWIMIRQAGCPVCISGQIRSRLLPGWSNSIQMSPL